jgi:hypothetical protein
MDQRRFNAENYCWVEVLSVITGLGRKVTPVREEIHRGEVSSTTRWRVGNGFETQLKNKSTKSDEIYLKSVVLFCVINQSFTCSQN